MAGTKLTRRTMLGALAAAPFAGPARAQAAWPSKPVRVMIPYPPAGGADTTGRIVFGKLGEALGQQFVVENRGGAGGTIGEAVVAKAEPDGYTVLARRHGVFGQLRALSESVVRLQQGLRPGVRWCRWCQISWW